MDWGVDALRLAEHELLVFAAFWFTIGALDELAIDAVWLWLRATGRVREESLPPGYEARPLVGRLAVMVPAWREPDVIGEMIAHTLAAWPQPNLTLYVGCYRNDAATLAAAIIGAHGDPRVRLVVHDRAGPTTKADCLNRLYAAMVADERRSSRDFTGVVLHDAEDMVHPAALAVIDNTLEANDYVQLPVRPEPQSRSPWIAGHYSDEFTEAHAKTLVVRDALGAGIPTAGVGCGFSRAAVSRMARWRADHGGKGPFAPDSLTEDYEVGLLLARSGARGRFVRLRDADGALVATRAFFPSTIQTAVRQKTRWIHGIALQGWDRMGWTGLTVASWMALRDRKGPLLALVLASAYALVLVEGLLLIVPHPHASPPASPSPLLAWLVMASFVSFVWRATWRVSLTAYEYGWLEGVRSLLRIPVANVIAIMAGHRALTAYIATLRGGALRWDKTDHAAHPATMTSGALAR